MKVKTMKVSKIRNAVKNLPRGSYRVADGASVLGEGRSEQDHALVLRTTPLQTKIKEFEADKERLGTELAPDINKEREGRTTRLRRAKDVRPL